MIRGLLDTDTCIYALNGNATVLERLRAHGRTDLFVSAITEAELRVGAAKSSKPVKMLRILQRFLSAFKIAEFTSEDAAAYAHVRAKLERAGTPIGALDTLIAAQAIARELTLVSNNEREFKRVAGLRLENWA
jgi:tRNA(fMet)-specific endonuclease VapC